MFLSNSWELFQHTWFSPMHSLFFVRQSCARRRYRRFFDCVEKHPLTLKQRQAIIVDEKRNLIIAGAGTGKTSTIVGKVGYLTKSKKCKAGEILVIAYNRNAAEELRERIVKKLGIGVEVGTFHAIGKKILHDSKHPSRPHEFVDQEEKLFTFLDQILKRCIGEGDFADLYTEYFKNHEFKNIDEVRDFKTELEYANWLRSNKLITLNNEIVKSHGELLIANFLFSNGVEYQYESFYLPNNSMPEVDYRPDFYIPEYGIYIEYFGIDEKGNTAEFIDAEKYRSDMEWKFNTHREGNTKLIDLYFYQKRDRKLQSVLREKLEKLGVEFSPKPQEELFEVINNTKKGERFLRLVESFLSQYKEKQHVLELKDLVKKGQGDHRTLLFLSIFRILLKAYQQELTKNRRIDFGDMISKSAEMVSLGKVDSNYKYIIIDEFQDISEGRYHLISEMLKQNPSTKLFCVGDDCQAIYRFAGSDHKIMTSFRSLFGRSTILKLDETFRYNDQIASVSERFITKNPSQIKKNLQTFSQKTSPQVFVHWHSDDRLSAATAAIDCIKQEYETENQTLLILSRYNHNKFRNEALSSIEQSWKGGTIQQKTVHSAKGLEADFVIVSDLSADDYGFPSEIQDDPILNLVLSEEDYFIDSEERRLFYVALTRTKQQAHLICDSVLRSRFAAELTNGGYAVHIIDDDANHRKCPACSGGVIVKKTGPHGEIPPLLQFSCMRIQTSFLHYLRP